MSSALNGTTYTTAHLDFHLAPFKTLPHDTVWRAFRLWTRLVDKYTTKSSIGIAYLCLCWCSESYNCLYNNDKHKNTAVWPFFLIYKFEIGGRSYNKFALMGPGGIAFCDKMWRGGRRGLRKRDVHCL